MKLANLFRRRHPQAGGLYVQVVEQARQPAFYALWGVPDTVLGRFEMIALHMFLLLRRCKNEGDAGARLGQDLFDTMFEDMDRNLRQLGTGDLAVGRRIKSLAKSLYGRIAAYERGLGMVAGAGEGGLEEALVRNAYFGAAPEPAHVSALAAYLRSAAAALDGQAFADIAAGRLHFPALPAAAA